MCHVPVTESGLEKLRGAAIRMVGSDEKPTTVETGQESGYVEETYRRPEGCLQHMGALSCPRKLAPWYANSLSPQFDI